MAKLNPDFDLGIEVDQLNLQEFNNKYQGYLIDIEIDFENIEIIEGDPSYLIFGSNHDQPLIVEESTGKVYQISEREQLIFIAFNSNLHRFKKCLDFHLTFFEKNKQDFKLCNEEITLQKINELRDKFSQIDQETLKDENCYWEFVLEELEFNYS